MTQHVSKSFFKSLKARFQPVYVTSILRDGRGGFAITMEGTPPQSVYIPAGIVSALKPKIGEVWFADLVTNHAPKEGQTARIFAHGLIRAADCFDDGLPGAVYVGSDDDGLFFDTDRPAGAAAGYYVRIG